jgi:hypothetical protein
VWYTDTVLWYSTIFLSRNTVLIQVWNVLLFAKTVQPVWSFIGYKCKFQTLSFHVKHRKYRHSFLKTRSTNK